jgi:hypothetical protein
MVREVGNYQSASTQFCNDPIIDFVVVLKLVYAERMGVFSFQGWEVPPMCGPLRG